MKTKLTYLLIPLALLVCAYLLFDVEEPPLEDAGLVEAGEEASDRIVIAEDEAEWPPYLVRDDSADDGVRGAGVDLLRDVLKAKGYEYEFRSLPWRRAQFQVEDGTFQILNNASSNAERTRKYLRSEPVYAVRHVFYYLRDRFPRGPPIRAAADVDRFSVAGMRGYNFGTLGFDAARIHEVGSNQALLKMLRQKRCDLIIGYLEIWESFEAMGVLDLEGIDHVEIPESEPLVFHVWVSRNYRNAQQLLRAINEGLAELEASGRKREIFNRYAIR